MGEAEYAQGSAATLSEVGVVAIGRNEGHRLQRCFDSVAPDVGGLVYVDSGSTDGSAEEAARRGIDVVGLDTSIPFTAARARNAGVMLLRARYPSIRFVQLVDGDCTLVPGWIEAAVEALRADPRCAVVCGRRREVDPGRSVYNRLADAEWDGPVGEVQSCGGDAMVRIDALVALGGFDERLIAGEEPEFCARLRARGFVVRRIAREMTAHDAAMTRFSQWWRRAIRSGYGFADVGARHRHLYRRERRSCVFWGILLPSAALVSAVAVGGASSGLLLLGYPVLWARILARRRTRGDLFRDAGAYATFCVLGKFPEALGVAKRWRDGVLRRRGRLIEYK